MKHSYILTALPIAAAAIAFTACGGKEDDILDIPETPGVEIDGPTIEDSKPLSPEGQKEYLEGVAEAFMKLTPASDFAEYSDLANYCSEHFDEDRYDWDDVDDWGNDVWNSLLVKTGTSQDEDYNNTYIYTNYNALIAASNFTGHFEDRGDHWQRTDASDLQFSFKDDSGAQVVATLSTSGSTKKVNIGEFEVYDSGVYDYSHYTDYYNNYKTTVVVPEKIDFTIKKGSTTLVHTVVNIDLSSLSGDNFVNASNLSLTQATELSNGYKVQLTQVKYSAGQSAAVTFAFSNKQGKLFSAAIGADLKGLPQFNSGTWSDDDYDDDDLDLMDGSIPQIAIDILGKVQIKGSISDIHKFIDYMDEADECSSSDRSGIQAALNKANRLLDLGIYYDGKSIRQANVTLEAVLDEEWNGRKYYEIMPVLNFEDGTSYDTFEAFFNDSDFGSAIRAFKRLANNYSDLIDEADRPF